MTKITKFYIQKAKYIAFGENGKKYYIDINYWENKYKISGNSSILMNSARNFLDKKHRVNFVEKLIQ